MKKVEYKNGLDFDLDEEVVEQTNDLQPAFVQPYVSPTPVVKKAKAHKAVCPLGVSDSPSVTLHKGGGKIVITPNDVHSAVALIEIRERIAQLANPVLTATREKLEIQLLPDVQPGDFARATRAWSLVNVKLDEHPMVRLLARYNLGVTVSPSLANWVKKEEKRLAKELTPFLLVFFIVLGVASTLSAAGSVNDLISLTCGKDMLIIKVKVLDAFKNHTSLYLLE